MSKKKATTNTDLDPLVIIEMLLSESDSLGCLEDVYSKLGRGFSDMSDDADVVQEWKELGLTAQDNPHMLGFRCGAIRGELELVFNKRLVQAGVQVYAAPSEASLQNGLYDAVKMLLSVRYPVVQINLTRIMFSDNRVNGYLDSIIVPGGGSSVVFRLANLRWCAMRYGGNQVVTVPSSLWSRIRSWWEGRA